MATVASPPPSRVPEGSTSDAPWQPLADCGYGNSAFYHVNFDDFDASSGTPANFYTVSVAGTGAAVASVAVDGGAFLYTAGTTAGSASTQNGKASFTVNSAPKKVFFQTRMQASAAALGTATVSLLAGLIQTTATPGTVTDGVYFTYSNGVLKINSTIASATTSVTIPTAAYSSAIVANTNFDLAFYINRAGDVLAFVDTQLVGFVPQSNIGTTNGPQNAGAVARMTAPSLTTAILNPTLAIIQGGTTASCTMQVDFFGAYKER